LAAPSLSAFLRLFAANPRRSDDDTPDSLHQRIQLAEHELYSLKTRERTGREKTQKAQKGKGTVRMELCE
jgi:folate-dependent phosphoribosylglycinamide formyltransferase PurN